MARDPEEAPQMVRTAKALVLNIGALTGSALSAMLKAGLAANRYNIPVILDPVGAGSTKFRTEAANLIAREVKLDIIKGNASEIRALVGEPPRIKGVESEDLSPEEVYPAALHLARQTRAVVAVTGTVDITVRGNNAVRIYNGHPLMREVVGTGCMCSAVIASFAAVEKDFLRATATALVSVGIAGELAGKNSRGPASFKVNFLDEISLLTDQVIEQMARVEPIS